MHYHPIHGDSAEIIDPFSCPDCGYETFEKDIADHHFHNCREFFIAFDMRQFISLGENEEQAIANWLEEEFPQHINQDQGLDLRIKDWREKHWENWHAQPCSKIGKFEIWEV